MSTITEDIRVLQIGYMITTELYTVGPTARAVNFRSYVFLPINGHDFQSVILIFFTKISCN